MNLDWDVLSDEEQRENDLYKVMNTLFILRKAEKDVYVLNKT
jgi:hypothetical protein